MKMAVSQAKFLQMATKQNNLDYMKQQINKSRMALFSASAELFRQRIALVSPTPPSSHDKKYVKPSYMFKYQDGCECILSINKEIDADESQIKSICESFGIVLNNNQRAFLKDISIKNAESYFDDGVDFEVKDAEALLIFDEDLLSKVVLLNINDDNIPCIIENFYLKDLFDEVLYGIDMNKYEFEKSSYDYQLEKINNEINLIKNRENSLDIKMQQLDIECMELAIEMSII